MARSPNGRPGGGVYAWQRPCNSGPHSGDAEGRDDKAGGKDSGFPRKEAISMVRKCGSCIHFKSHWTLSCEIVEGNEDHPACREFIPAAWFALCGVEDGTRGW